MTRLHEELSKMYEDIADFIATNPSFDQRVWQSGYVSSKATENLSDEVELSCSADSQ